MPMKNGVLSFKGSACLRQRLTLSILSGKAVNITKIRHNYEEPGLQEYEINLVRLLDKVTNGSVVEINETGTTLYFQPGLLQGGKIDHDCSLQRAIGYYLEALLYLGPFCKVPLKATLRGITSNFLDPSVDHIKTSALPLMKEFIVDDEIDVRIINRGLSPLGGGEIIFTCPIRRTLRPVQLLESGMVKRIRGTAYALRVSPAIANRMVESAKGVLLNFIPDVYITTDQRKGKESGRSPGFGIHLYAETNKGVFYSAELTSESGKTELPEDLGFRAAQCLLNEIYLGGCTDSGTQAVAILFMALGQKDVSKVVLGPLSEYSVCFLQNLREFFGLVFKLDHVEDEQTSPKVSLTCVGIGFSNLSKKTV